MGKILDGKACATEVKEQVKKWIKEDLRKPPVLAIFTVGDDDASKVYVRNKIKAAEEVGIIAKHYIITKEQYYQEEFLYDRIQDAIDEADGVHPSLLRFRKRKRSTALALRRAFPRTPE